MNYRRPDNSYVICQECDALVHPADLCCGQCVANAVAEDVENARADGYRAGIEEMTQRIARSLGKLADGFHFAGDLTAEKSLRGWIKDALAPAKEEP